jgi:hypothetical protein
MKKHLAWPAFLLLIVFMFSSCILDPKEKLSKKEPPPSPWEDLKEKDDVFHNLLEAYKQMNIVQYDRLLDEEFIFHFSQADIENGLPQEQWGRADELRSTEHMFSRYEDEKYGAITSIDLILDKSGPWFEFYPEAPYEGEIWYQKTVTYSITAQTTSPWELQGLDMDALFTVRFAEADGDTIWRIITWYDDIGSQ